MDRATDFRVKKWSLTLEDLVNDPTGLREFKNYLETEYSHENLLFWHAVNDLRRCPQSEIKQRVANIFA